VVKGAQTAKAAFPLHISAAFNQRQTGVKNLAEVPQAGNCRRGERFLTLGIMIEKLPTASFAIRLKISVDISV
jgi:hypothetical protein